ncbi:MAG: TatD family deoxyribonuclease [Desulfobacteraceae bacterium]|nr:MAG: TatD family deoxyribonuclease [Desulfobacteraceae bacterium]
MLTDSHAHLEMEEFDHDREQMLERAVKGGVTRVITIGTDLQSSAKAVELAIKYDFLFSAVGCHPHNAKECDRNTIEELGKLATSPRVVAWGEIGLDFFKLYSEREIQLASFKEQLELASRLDLPVIIHDRDAHQEILAILRQNRSGRLRGVIHCFSGDYPTAMEFISLGFFISIPGTVTYKKAPDIREVAARIPLDTLLVETDAPYLTPVPFRGKRNEPLFVVHTAEKVAALRGMDFHEFCAKTEENTSRIFGLGKQA